MKLENYQDMQLLHEVVQNPRITQRDLGKRIGAALGLTNSRLHRLCTKGFIKIVESDKKRIRYLVTREGISEKNRLISEYLAYSLQYYSRLRKFLKEQLTRLKEKQLSRVLLLGTGEIAEVAYLTIQEEGLSLVGVLGNREQKKSFFHLPVRDLSEIDQLQFDRILVATQASSGEIVQQLLTLGIAPAKILQVPDDQSLFTEGNSKESFVPGVPSADAHATVLHSLVRSSSFVDNGKHVVTAFKKPTPATTDVVILCGGKGTRLGKLTNRVPKPLLPVEGEPFLLRLLLRLQSEGFTRFILSGHYLSEQFQEFLETYRSQLPQVRLVVEPELLGTGGALRFSADAVASSPFVVVNGDSWVAQPLAPVLEEHGRLGREFTVVAVQANQVEGEALKKGVWRIGPEREVAGFTTQESVVEGWVNAGCYVINHEMVSLWPKGSYSLEDNLPILLTGRRTGVFCSEGKLLDIGTTENYLRAGEVLDQLQPLEQKVAPV